MSTTLAELLRDPRFHLALRVAPSDARTLQRPISWVHSSDLPDPTPWLEAGQFLLTDGMQFQDHGGPAFVASYVARLRERGILALGLAADILLGEVPAALLEACAAQDLALIEVTDRTPFMAIIRHVADEVTRTQTRDLERSLEAHRSVARAALRPDGLHEIVAELERRLDSWVELYDGNGALTAASTRRHAPAELEPAVRTAVRTALVRRISAGHHILEPGNDISVQTIGTAGELRGVLIVGTTLPLDRWSKDLVSSVLALASIALEQHHVLQSARSELRSGLLELLFAGEVATARRIGARFGAGAPQEPLRVMVLRDAIDDGAAMLESLLGGFGPDVFFAQREMETVIIVADSLLEAVAERLASTGLTLGVSEPTDWPGVRTGLAEARRAATDATEAAPIGRFGDLVARGIRGAAQRGNGMLVARAMLAPLFADPALLQSIRVWFHHNCVVDPAARELGMHRHTLQARIDAAGALLGLHLERFSDRAELWSALDLADAPA